MFLSLTGIDFGTSSINICADGKEITLSEPSVAAKDVRTGEICAMGSAAYAMTGRVPEEIRMLYPVSRGVISDYKLAGRMLKKFIRRAVGGHRRTHAAVCVPLGATEVEKRAAWDAVFGAGIGNIQMIEAPVAAALGAGLDISKPEGHLIVDIGAGITNIAVISMNNIVKGLSVAAAGDDFDRALIQYIEENHELLIGKATAEQVKKTAGSVFPGNEMREMQVSGWSMASKRPEKIVMTSAQARAAMDLPVRKITDGIRQILAQTPPELAADIAENGIVLTGGSALLDGFDRLVEDVSGIHTVVAAQPDKAGALGAAMYLNAVSSMGRKKLRNSYKKYTCVEEEMHTDAGLCISGHVPGKEAAQAE